MASAEAWILNLLGAAFYGIGAYIVVKHVLPLVNGFLSEIVKYKTSVNSLVKLLEIFVYVTAATGIIGRLIGIGNHTLSYISVVSPALGLINGIFLPFVQLLVIGGGILLVVERLKLK